MAHKHKILRSRLISTLKVLVIVGVFLGGALAVWASTLTIPALDTFDERRVLQSTKIFDRTGEVVLFDFNRDVRRTVIPSSEMSRHIKNATVAIEDSSFYSHPGIDFGAIVRASFVNLGSLEFKEGGSTITQQVVKNSLLTPEKTIQRKIKEWVLAIKLERELEKQKILEIYLNEIPYGGNIYGIEEASQRYFGKPASALGIVESAYLAALPKAPTYFSPYGNHRDELESRKNTVLARMKNLNFISDEEYEEAVEKEVDFEELESHSIKAAHFVFFVREYLEAEYGTQAVETQGLRVVTTLDYELQKKAEDIVEEHARENEERFNAENASLVATDPHTGQILVMVGSRDYFDESIDGKFNAAISHRQPGSAFKPFVYATAFEKGYTPDTVVFDLKTQFSTACSPTNLTSNDPCYSPGNYDNAFRGPITFRNALAQSVNIPAVKVLYLAGMRDALQTARDMGISSLTNASRYGLTLVLGGGEVSLLDMTSAYGVFANEGVKYETSPIMRIEDNRGNMLEEFEEKSNVVLPSQTARTISDILSDNAARAPAFGAQSYLHFPGRDVAVKTGTTNDYRDAWIIGYTPDISVGAWAGNNDNSPMVKRVAGFIVAPMWNAFMQEVLGEYGSKRFKEPVLDYQGLKPILRGVWQTGLEFSDVDTSDDSSDDSDDDEEEDETFENDEPVSAASFEVHSILHWVDKNNPRGPAPSNPARDPQYPLWEHPVRQWGISQFFLNNPPVETSEELGVEDE